MKKILPLTILLISVMFLCSIAIAGTEIFKESKGKNPEDTVIYDLIIHSKEWYTVKSLFNVKTYTKKAKLQKENDIIQGQKKLSLYIQKIAEKYKVYFEDVVDIFNEYNKKYIFQISGDEKNPDILVKKKNV